ncbi:MAG: hypothetical protein AAGG81_01185 [Chlamydiota bacterium]
MKNGLLRLSGPFVAVASSLLTLCERVGSVVETILKGLGNILIFPFTKKCEFLKGLKQLFIELPINVLSLIFSPLEIGFGAVITIGSILIRPEEYSEGKSKLYKELAALIEDNDSNVYNCWPGCAII